MFKFTIKYNIYIVGWSVVLCLTFPVFEGTFPKATMPLINKELPLACVSWYFNWRPLQNNENIRAIALKMIMGEESLSFVLLEQFL